MASKNEKYFQPHLVFRRTKKEESSSCFNFTDSENMREQPAVTRLVYSARRSGKSEKSDENGEALERKTKAKTKAVTKSDDSSSSTVSLFDGCEKRRSLQALQPSADGQKLLVGGRNRRAKPKNKKLLKDSLTSSQKQLKIYETKTCGDTQSSSSEVESILAPVGSDVPADSDEVYALMTQDQAPEKYWELVAEERRKALEETVKENMELYGIIKELKAENEALKEKANNTEYFATMYKVAKEVVLPSEEPVHDS